MIAPTAILFGADIEPQMNTKVCNPANSSCAGVTSSRLDVNATQSGTWSNRLQDGSGNAITSSVVDTKRGIDTNPIKYAPSISTTGSLTALNSTVSFTNLDGMSSVGVDISGAWVGTITFEGSIDCSTWNAINGALIGGGTIGTSTTSNGAWRVNVGGLCGFRVRRSVATSGTASITMIQTHGSNPYNFSYLRGGTTGAFIGNIGDRLKVDSNVTLAGGTTQSYTSKLRYDDMNVSTGGIARGTSVTAASGWNQLYSYTGSGQLMGVIISLETKDDWQIRIVVDGEELFGTGTGEGILSTDLHTDSIYDSDTSGRSVPELDQDVGLYWGAHDRFQWVGPVLIPVTFTTSVKVYVKRSTGAATKKFQAGFVVIEKKT